MAFLVIFAKIHNKLTPYSLLEEIENDKKMVVLESFDKWLGVTYKEDKESVVNEIKKLVDNGEYPNNLWK